MSSTDNKAAIGQAALKTATEEIQACVGDWRAGSKEEKGRLAEVVLSHVGGYPGMTLAGFGFDEKTVEEIRRDYHEWKAKQKEGE